MNTELLRIRSPNLGLNTCESLVSILSNTKKVCGSAQLEQTGMWCVSVISCPFLPPLFFSFFFSHRDRSFGEKTSVLSSFSSRLNVMI